MYRHYTTGQKLMTLLIERFTLPPPAGNVLAQEEWKQRVQTPIRLRYSCACGCVCGGGVCCKERVVCTKLSPVPRALMVYVTRSLRRVYNLLKLWIAKHFDDFEQDPALTDMLFRFIVPPPPFVCACVP